MPEHDPTARPNAVSPSPADGHSGRLHSSAGMRGAARALLFKCLRPDVSVLLGVHLGVALLSHTAALCLTLWGPVQLSFHSGHTPFYCPTSKTQEASNFSTSSPTPVVSHCLCFKKMISPPVGVTWYLLWLQSAFLHHDVECRFTRLPSIPAPSLQKCLFKSFAHVKTGFSVSLPLCCKGPFYSPDTRRDLSSADPLKRPPAALHSRGSGPGWRGLGSCWAVLPEDVTLFHGFIGHLLPMLLRTGTPRADQHLHLDVQQAGQT